MAETMRDRGTFWTPAPAANATIERGGFTARFVDGFGQTLVSGNLDKAIADLTPGLAEVGLWGLADDGSCAVRIARDRALLVTSAPLDIAAGWRDGYVATPCDDAYAVIELSGPTLAEAVAEASAVDVEAGSPSASLLFAGITALLYRTSPSTARLHVERPLAAYLWTWLENRR